MFIILVIFLAILFFQQNERNKSKPFFQQTEFTPLINNNEINKTNPLIQQQTEITPLINVKLINYLGNVKELSVSLNGSYRVNGEEIVEANKTYLLRLESDQLALYDGTIKIQENASFTFTPNVYNNESFIKINNRDYLGSIEFVREGVFIRPINTLPVEDYLKGVVPHEMPASWSIDALKVQAIASRTYAMSHGNKIIDDSVNYQVYAGYEWFPHSTKAVNETSGQTLRHNGEIVLAVYSSTNGGITESNFNIWGGERLPYLPIKEDPYDPLHRWKFQITKTQIDLSDKDLNNPSAWWTSSKEADLIISNNIKKWLAKNGYPNSDIKIISIPHLSFLEDRTSGGRVLRGNITFQYATKSSTTDKYMTNEDDSLRIYEMKLENATAQRIRSILGANLIKSYLVDTVINNDTAFVISGRGFGHGVGMSQWGAKRMADLGFNYREILQFYYPGTTLGMLSQVQKEINKEELLQLKREIMLTIDDKQAKVDGKSIQLLAPPFIKNQRTLIPLRFVSEQLGANVYWSKADSTITITDQNRTLLLSSGSKSLTVNGVKISIDVAPEIIKDVTYVPLRFVSEQLNGTVDWNSLHKTIIVKRTILFEQR